jgi:hypothetical protein
MSEDRKNVVDMAGAKLDDDYLLSMYIDNELDAERTVALLERLRAEPILRARLTQLEGNDSLLRTLYRKRHNIVPGQLSAMLRADNVAPLRSARSTGRWMASAVAASFGVIALLMGLNQNTALNAMTMDQDLANALETSSSQATGWVALGQNRGFRSVLTFPAADGRWCREFLLTHDESHWRGVACRDNGTWVNQVVGSEIFLEQATQYRPAGADGDEKVARFIDETAVDIALGPQEESALIKSGW